MESQASHYKKWKRVVDNKMKDAYGDIDDEKKIIKINKKAHKKGHRLPSYNKNPDGSESIIDTIVHEEQHRIHPKMHEKTVYKRARKIVKKISRKQKARYYAKYA
jgi:hypothetical protein